MAYKVIVDKDVTKALIQLKEYHKKHYHNNIIPKRISRNIKKLILELKDHPYRYNIDEIHPQFRKVVFIDCSYKINYYIDEKSQIIYI